jgi:hypothetical protein
MPCRSAYEPSYISNCAARSHGTIVVL